MIAAVLAAAVLSSAPLKTSTAPCKTVDDCWLSADGDPIARPKSKKGHKIPQGNCGDRLVWLRNILSCEQNVCAAQFIGDKC